MNKHTRMALISPLIALALLSLAACNNTTPEAAAPTTAPAVQAQATATTAAPAVATDTPAPTAPPAPTDTAAPTAAEATSAPSANTSGAGAKSGVLVDALKKFQSATSYRAQMTMEGKGALGLTGDTTITNEQVSLFELSGEFAGANSHYTLKGFLSTLLGVDADKGVEAMLLGDKGYIHGPVSMLGADQDKWYVLESDQAEAIRPPIAVTDFLSGLGDGSVDLSAFKANGTQSLDGKQCNVYTADKDTTIKAFGALNAGALPGVADLTTVQNASANFLLCDDGFLHQLALSVDTASKDQPDQKATFTVNLHIYDFGAAIKVAAPANAIPLQTPDMTAPTPTPKK